jgi:hypothetical protein
MVIVVVGRIHDRLRRRIFAPLLLALGLGRRRYTGDPRLACAEEASRTTYGEASESILRSLGVHVPRRTIWIFVQELAPYVEQGTRSVPLHEENGAHLADGTYVPGWSRGRLHEVNIAVRQRASDHSVEVLGIQIGGPARAVLGPMPVDRLATDDALTYSTDGTAEWHSVCHVHFIRRLTALLVEEKGLMQMAEREAVARDLSGVLGHLGALVEKHQLDGNRAAVTDRVAATLAHWERWALTSNGEGYVRRGDTFGRVTEPPSSSPRSRIGAGGC